MITQKVDIKAYHNFCKKKSLEISRKFVMKLSGTINITRGINELRSRKLHLNDKNPIGIIKRKIEDHFSKEYNNLFKNFDNLSEIVTVQQNFEDLLIPKDHPSRNLSDTYYFDNETILRPQTSAHQTEIMRKGHKAFLITGDCYRKDTIDQTHYPVFHQMEGVRIWHESEIWDACKSANITLHKYCEIELKRTLDLLVHDLFPGRQNRWSEDYFPFTDPSFEMEVELDENKWLEIFGSGVINQKILNNLNMNEYVGWAFGLGLERLAMVLFDIHDIRQFWSKDKRFTDQYKDGKIRTFKKYSKYPACYKDISFWILNNTDTNDDRIIFDENELMDIVRNVAGDIIEDVCLMDEFINPKTGLKSMCYRFDYRHTDRTLTNDEVNDMHVDVRNAIENSLKVDIRG